MPTPYHPMTFARHGPLNDVLQFLKKSRILAPGRAQRYYQAIILSDIAHERLGRTPRDGRRLR